jgi:adenylate kinase
MNNQSQTFHATAAEAGWPVGHRVSPGRVLLFGAPGVGKGTQARQMERLWGIPHISTGDVLRSHVNRGTSLGRMAKEIMRRGELVPDSLICEIVATRLQEADTVCGFILDGFPRTLYQAFWLDSWLGAQGFETSIVPVSIRVDYKLLLRRITGRRTCPVCQAIYNVYLNRPKRDGICDIEGAALARRTDDTEQGFEERIRAYETLTAPVVEHYRALQGVVDVDGDRPIGEIAAYIVAGVDRFRRSFSNTLAPVHLSG